MNLGEIRQSSWATASKLGYPRNDVLPLLDRVHITRSKDEVTDRIFAILCVAASAYGFERNKALQWLGRNAKLELLTNSERTFLDGVNENNPVFTEQIEGMWALCWCLNIVPKLDFAKPCSNSFVKLLPDLKKDEPGSTFREKAVLRDLHEVVPKLDLAYCLHWAIVRDALGARSRGPSPALYVTIERRRALEWMFSDQLWEEVSMDT
jgi:hypothetical protein